MADDGQHLIERTQSADENADGRPMSVDELVENFVLHGLEKRASMLERVDTELRGEIGAGSHSLRRHAQLMGLRRKLDGLHEALRKAKR